MALIQANGSVYTVMVHIAVEPENQQELLRLCTTTAPVFAEQPGFVSSCIHRSHDGRSVINYLQWRSQADHEACMANPNVAEAGKEFMAFVEAGKARFDVQTYDVCAVLDA